VGNLQAHLLDGTGGFCGCSVCPSSELQFRKRPARIRKKIWHAVLFLP
jgi:hypothetical protein